MIHIQTTRPESESGRKSHPDTRRRRWLTSEEEVQQEASNTKQTKPKADDPLALKEKEIGELTDTLKRVQAEFENFKKRNQKEWTERVKFANQDLIGNLLAVLDSFDKALEDAKKNTDLKKLRAGIEGVHRQLVQTLQREGLEEIKTDGKFDPFVHEALVRDEREDVEDGKIVEVFQKGYTLGPITIRPARVRVARRREPEGIRQKEGYEDRDKQIIKTEPEEKEEAPSKR